MFAKLLSILSVGYLIKPERHYILYDEEPRANLDWQCACLLATCVPVTLRSEIFGHTLDAAVDEKPADVVILPPAVHAAHRNVHDRPGEVVGRFDDAPLIREVGRSDRIKERRFRPDPHLPILGDGRCRTFVIVPTRYRAVAVTSLATCFTRSSTRRAVLVCATELSVWPSSPLLSRPSAYTPPYSFSRNVVS